ncbi:hypothetical protein FPOAC1_000205 [Fusarium poae]|uniref:hypothetical protein n=1 Tax=Fusarium poae TaxID=36050 RepID=UPI001CEB640D|nr:hypothetical protein FPOAC1_000205 [Fusarium poae]KAG8674241.1 hypothetical protein FPOAC1_000205 [Fusarium poae]
MFRWYEQAKICFAYLSDVSASDDHKIKDSSFRRSRWFKRGWTLQELLAPIELAFYDKDWKPILTRSKARDLIGEITGIRTPFLSYTRQRGGIRKTLSTASVAERMSWMKERETTKPEDIAYCLLGIFDVNMPMIYGEGLKAFQRLQEEIMKKSDDSTLLSWGYQDPDSYWRYREDSLLAPHPSFFRGCGDLEPSLPEAFNAATFSMNQRGLQMEVPIRADLTHELLVYMILSCSPRLETESFPYETESSSGSSTSKSFVAVPLVSTRACSVFQRDPGTQKGQYLRPRWCRPILVSEKFLGQAQSTSIVIRSSSEQFRTFELLPISIAIPPVPVQQGYDILGIYPPQPIGSRLVLVSHQAGLLRNLPGSTRYVPPPALASKTSLPLIYSRDHQTMIQIRMEEFGTFLVLFDYRAVAWRMAQTLTIWKYSDISCRIFKTPENYGLEALHSLSITQDFTNLPEVDSIFRVDRYMFKIGTGADAYIVIQLTKDEKLYQITDISIHVTGSSSNFHEQRRDGAQNRTAIDALDMMERLKGIGQLSSRQTPSGLLDCVSKQLGRDFPNH